MKPTITNRVPAACSAAMTSRHPAGVCDRGFSQSTRLPARMQASDSGAWVASGAGDHHRIHIRPGDHRLGVGGHVGCAERVGDGACAGGVAVADDPELCTLHLLGQDPRMLGPHEASPDEGDSDGHVTLRVGRRPGRGAAASAKPSVSADTVLQPMPCHVSAWAPSIAASIWAMISPPAIRSVISSRVLSPLRKSAAMAPRISTAK